MLSTLSLCVTLATGQAGYRSQYPLPSLNIPSGWGVNIHFTRPRPGEIDQIADAGFRWVRMDLYWDQIERERGRYDFSRYDELMAGLRARRIRPMFILDYGNDLYQQGSPRTNESRAAFARFVAAAVRRYKGQGVIWEMWNEPNIHFWKPRPNVDQYIALAKEVGRTIRRVAPQEWHVGPATSGFDWPFLRRCFDAGLLQYWDAVTVHPYRRTEPETVATDWARLRALINSKAPKGKRIPMFSGEWGYSERYPGMDAERQGWYIARQYLANLASGVPMSIYYDWANDGTDPREEEHWFGTVDTELRPKPAFHAVRHLVGQLQGYRYHTRLSVGSRNDYVLAFKKGTQVKLVAYTRRRGGIRAKLPTGNAQFRLTSPRGARSLGTAQIALSEEPVVLTPTKTSAALKAIAMWEPMPAISGFERQTEVARFLKESLASVQKLELPAESRVEVIDSAEEPERLPGARGRTTFALLQKKGLEAGSAADEAYDVDPRPRYLRVAITLPDGTELAQETTVVQPRPLTLEFPPAAKGLTVRIDNPQGRAMRGAVVVSRAADAKKAVFDLKADAPHQDVNVPVPAAWLSDGVRVAVVDAVQPKKALLSLPGLVVRRFDAFAQTEGGSLDRSRYEVVQEGDEKLRAQFDAQSELLTEAPASLTEGLRIGYDFPVGWKFLTLQTRGELAKPLPGEPVSLGMWVFGDASGDILRMRFTDATGQTFQPDAGAIDWTGWKFVSFPLDGVNAGRWGGANDGVVHHPIKIDTLALIDSYDKKGGTGAVTLAGITLVSKLPKRGN